MDPVKLYLAVDVEGTGPRPLLHPPKAFGFCLGTADGTVLEKRLIGIRDVRWDQIESRCKREFWDKFEDVWKRIDEKSELALRDVPNAIKEYLDRVERTWPASEITVLSDNPAYDVAAVDRMLERVRDYPLRYTGSGDYRCICDPSEQAEGLTVAARDAAYAYARGRAAHDHMPDNDAEFIYHLMIGVNLAKQKPANVDMINAEGV